MRLLVRILWAVLEVAVWAIVTAMVLSLVVAAMDPPSVAPGPSGLVRP